MSSSSDHAISFGSFRLISTQRLLLESGKPVQLGSRALEILLALVERAGESIRREDLIARVWPHSIVDDSNLKVHIAALRKALGDGLNGNRYIVNIPGRGYRFVAPILKREEIGSPTSTEAALQSQNARAPIHRVFGRSKVTAALRRQLSEYIDVCLQSWGRRESAKRPSPKLTIIDQITPRPSQMVCSS